MTLNTFARAMHNPDHAYLDAVAAQAEVKFREVRTGNHIFATTRCFLCYCGIPIRLTLSGSVKLGCCGIHAG